MCKNFWKKHVFQFFRDIWTDLPHPPPYPHINVEKCYFCVAWTGVIKMTNTDLGEWGKKWVNGGKITKDRSRNVFQNIFAHDCSSNIIYYKVGVESMSPGRIFVKKLETIAFCIFAYANLFTTSIGNITQRLQFLCNCHFLNFLNFFKIDCRILFTVTAMVLYLIQKESCGWCY